jgi:23S rRNA (adenine2503-C2)-methyltransferase
MDDLAYGLGKRKVTISTAGIVPKILELHKYTDVSLALSLHAATDTLRDQLVPLNRKYPLADVIEACQTFVSHAPRKRITIEYVMLQGINDRPEDAEALIALLKDLPNKLNLIPFNPFPDAGFSRSSNNRIHAFQERLAKAGFLCTIRKTRGDDIAAACGQLVGQFTDRSTRQVRWHKLHTTR